ncbi:DUF2189 domain-containing protein [Roseivivax isoporae]|uniref:Cytochrome C oxidase subunit I n=1 Tax=Roseivivax isoporae LMG 25204 TaxID=1449351 RepID=X7F858_9RHOB|nr:DUF2189 domain-containing protein [Roseivivax isoporae]ETX29072.1 cytochrome C oxidase subunit I [Roseivivax isoporae LMG 25204]
MDRTIGNPLSWTARQFVRGSTHMAATTAEIGGRADAAPVGEDDLAELTLGDLRASLRLGFEDLMASRADALFLCLLYPVLGLCLVVASLTHSLAPLIFPLLSGFVLVGPLAALGLYEMSRQRERGERISWGSAFDVLVSPAFGAILVLGLYLVGLLVVWLISARMIYAATMGPGAPDSLLAFLGDTLTTPEGWTMIVVGMGVGFLFAVAVLATAIVSFPLLLDRNVGVPNAVVTSVRVTARNPKIVLTWGLIVAVGLFLGALPALVGLAIVLPVLGHASWHLYRRAVRPAPAA